MKKWWIHNNVINTNNQSFTNDVRLGTSTTGPTNSIYDKNQTLIFYINNKQVRSANGTLLVTLNLGLLSREYSIVPFVGMDPCNDEKYFIFYHSNNTTVSYGLRYVVIKVNKITRVASLDIPESWAYIGNLPVANSYALYGGIAVGKEINGRRFIYYVSGYDNTGIIAKLELSKQNNSNIGLSNPVIVYSSPDILYNVTELDLSPDGTKLAWSSSHNLQSYQFAYIINLNSLGNYNGTKKQYLIHNTLVTDCTIIKGVEFSDNGNTLFVGFPAGSSISLNNTGIYSINLISNTFQKIANSENYAFSQLERGSDGRIYVGYVNASSSLLNSFSQSFPHTFANDISIPLQREYLYNSTNPYLLTHNYAYLPDQIDGEDYEIIPNKISPIQYDISAPININNVQYWNGSLNPYSKSLINVDGTININQGGVLAINNMNLKFNQSSIINVNGGILYIDASTLQSLDCSIMWPGINVQNGGQVVFSSLYGTSQTDCLIKDAITGLYSNGSLNKIDINHVRFEKNENDVSLFNSASTNLSTINSISPNTLIRNSNFIHLELLKDQSKGLEYYSTNSGKKGVSGISIINSPSNIIVGPNNNFEGGRYGLVIEKSSVNVQNNNRFNNISGSLNANFPSTAIRIVSNNKNQKIVISGSNSIYRCQRGIISTGINDLEISSNIFSTTWETALNINKNKGGIIKVTNNQFTSCNWESIHFYDNGNISTQIEIIGNSIRDQPYASGIVVQELFLSTSRTFSTIIIKDNTIGDFTSKKIGQGIILRNIQGGEHSKASDNNNPKPSKSIVSFNSISFTTSYNQNYAGITIENSAKIATFNNTIKGDNYFSPVNAGILIKNSTDCSINWNNVDDCGSGLRAINSNNNSNYFCNTFTQNRNGVNLRDGHILRNVGQMHGICIQEARHNYYTSSINADINRTTTVNPNRNQWVFMQSNQPSLTVESVGGAYGGGTIKAPCFGIQECTFTIAGNTYEAAEQDGLQPEAFNWNVQFRNTQEALFNNLPIDPQSNFIKLIDVNNFFLNEKFDSAQIILSNFNATCQIENDYQALLQIILNINYPQERSLTVEEITSINNLAQSSTYFSGPQVYTARAILKFYTGEDYFDTEPLSNDIIGDIQTNCTSNELKGKLLQLIDENLNVIPGIHGKILEKDGELKFYFFYEQLGNLDPNISVSIFSPDSAFQIPSFKPLANWYNSPSFSNSLQINCQNSDKLSNKEIEIKVYPNPTTGLILIDYKDEIKFELLSVSGTKVLDGNVINHKIDLSQLSKGCYILKIISASDKEVIKNQKIILTD